MAEAGVSAGTNSAPQLSVIVCTWNRSSLLRQTLEQMTRLRTPSSLTWELLVVNNNCTDDTDRVLGEFASRLPLKRVFEPKPGHSNARNAGVAAALGEFTIWTDDDVLVDPEWLTAYADAIRRSPEASVFGGPVDPWFDGTPPEWLHRAFPVVSSAFAARDLGTEAIPFAEEGHRLPFGANMALRTAAQRVFRYDPELGRKENQMLSGDETAVIGAILRSGGNGFWVPGARVQHFIPRDRQTLDYVRRYYTGMGEVFGMQERAEYPVMILGRPLWIWRHRFETELLWRLQRFARPPEIWLDTLVEASLTRGRWKAFGRRAATRPVVSQESGAQ